MIPTQKVTPDTQEDKQQKYEKVEATEDRHRSMADLGIGNTTLRLCSSYVHYGQGGKR